MVSVGNGLTVIKIELIISEQPLEFVSVTCKVQVPIFVQLIEIKLFGTGPFVIVPAPPVPAKMLQV